MTDINISSIRETSNKFAGLLKESGIKGAVHFGTKKQRGKKIGYMWLIGGPYTDKEIYKIEEVENKIWEEIADFDLCTCQVLEHKTYETINL